LVEVAYQVAGAGQKPVKAWADLVLRPDPTAFLTARLGRLAWVKVGDITPPDPPDRPPPPHPEPPASPAADDEPSPGHPAWDRPPMEAPDPWEIAKVSDVDMLAWDKAMRGEHDGGVFKNAGKIGVLNENRVLTPVRCHAENQPAEGGASGPSVPADDLALATRTPRTGENGAAPVLVCDVPWLHPKVRAYAAADGGTTLLYPFCGQHHHHGGFGHRLAHCADPRGRGYVLVPAATPPSWHTGSPTCGLRNFLNGS